jgi:hypothetical protein
MKNIIHHSLNYKLPLLICLLLLSGCEDFLEAEDPLGQVNSAEVFKDETTATAAVTTLYGKLRDEVLLTGKSEGLSALMGVYSDELIYYGFGGDPMDNFYQHLVLPDDMIVENLWNGSYSLIYMTNAILEGLAVSPDLDPEIKKQLRGETLFVRSLVYFYLAELFGEIPYPTGTDYEVNRSLAKQPVSIIYGNIIADLTEAQGLLGTSYISGERVRANKMVVTALLSRIYLYMEQWDLAVLQSTILIDNPNFILEPDVEEAFLKESSSAILQFKPRAEGDNAQEAQTFLFSFGPPPLVSLNSQLVENMEPNDLRREYWIGEITDGNETWYSPKKYKLKENTGTSMEYSVIFRLSEQYLIRAEALARLGNLPAAKEDLDMVRNRAGLLDSEANTQNEVLTAIQMERYHELFSEFGHRWFDIKRTGLANEILAPLKAGWKPTDVLLPIPENELLMNPSLKPQNPGY